MSELKKYVTFSLLWFTCLILSILSASSEGLGDTYLAYTLYVVLSTNTLISVMEALHIKRNIKQ